MPAGNPFFHRGPVNDPDFFFGREREVGYIFDLLLKGQSVAISGPRRIGKTSLLFHLKEPRVAAARSFPFAGAQFSLLDGGTLDGLEEDCFYGAIDRSLGGNSDSVSYALFLERLRAEIPAGSANRLIVLIDEFELVAANPRFGLAMFNRLRGLSAQHPIQFVTASKNPLWQLTLSNRETLSSPFFNIFAPVTLGPLQDEDARRMLSELSARGEKPFSERTIDRILEFSGPHPLFLQVAAYRAFEAADSKGEIPAEEFARVRKAASADLEPHLRYYWDELDEENRYALTALPILACESAGLAETGLVRGGRYIGSVLEQFVRRQKVDGLLQGGPFLIDLRRSQVSVGMETVHLTPTEYSLLRAFLETPGRVLTPEDIEAALWPGEHALDPERARGAVKKLRGALGGAGELLVNRRGQGYLLVLEKPPISATPLLDP